MSKEIRFNAFAMNCVGHMAPGLWLALIEKIWVQRRFSIVLVTHDVEEAVALADRVLVMEHGQFVFEQEIPLARPRARTSPLLVELKDKILRRVMRS